MQQKQKSKKSKKYCKCELQRWDHEPCPNCSKYKLVFLLKDTNSPCKITDGQGKKVNPAKWSFLKEDKKPATQLFTMMIKRVRKSTEYAESRLIRLYDRAGNQVDEHKV